MPIHLFAVEKFAFRNHLKQPLSEFLRWLYHETDQTLCELIEGQLTDHSGMTIEELENADTPLSQVLTMNPALMLTILRALSVRGWQDNQLDYFQYTIEQLTGRDMEVNDIRDLLLDEEFQEEIIILASNLQNNTTANTDLLDLEAIQLLGNFYSTLHANDLQCVLVDNGKLLYS